MELKFVFLLSGADTCSHHHGQIKQMDEERGVAMLTTTAEETDGHVWKQQRGKITPKPQPLITGTSVLRWAPADYRLIPPIPRQQQDVAPQSTAQLHPAASLQMCVLIAEYERVRLFRTRPLLQEWLLLSSSAQKSAASSRPLPARLHPAKRSSGAAFLRGGPSTTFITVSFRAVVT